MLSELIRKKNKLAVGLMSGTSLDGIDAVLVDLEGWGVDTRVRQRAFLTVPYSAQIRARLLSLAEGSAGGSAELCRMHFLLGELFAEAVEALCQRAGVSLSDLDLIGSHGQTVWHIPAGEAYLGRSVRGTLQIGEPSILCERTGAVVVSDFRVRDISAGGQGAPLVPYTEYLLYRSGEQSVALQNIGGIGNITFLPRACTLDEVTAFDTGPGNMILDALACRMTGGRLAYDDGGRLAAAGRPSRKLLNRLLEEPYFRQPPPKTTGREVYGAAYVEQLLELARAMGVSPPDLIATATRFTAETIERAVRDFAPQRPDLLIVGGGGAMNPTLMRDIRTCLPDVQVLTNEEIGLDSNSKEAVAFAVLANEAVHSSCGNVPGATGASHPVVLGKISQ